MSDRLQKFVDFDKRYQGDIVNSSAWDLGEPEWGGGIRWYTVEVIDLAE